MNYLNIDDARKIAATQPGWLSQTPETFRKDVLRRCTLHRYAAGEALHAEGDEASSMYGIIEGQVKLYLAASDGEAYLAHILTAGTWGGEGPALIGAVRPVSLIAARATITLRLSHSAMSTIVTDDPTCWQMFVQRLMGHLTLSFVTVADTMIRDQTIRVVAILLRLAGLSSPVLYRAPQTKAEALEIAISQDELAGIANLGRTKISAILADLRAQGLVERAYGYIILLDPAGLHRIVRGSVSNSKS